MVRNGTSSMNEYDSTSTMGLDQAMAPQSSASLRGRPASRPHSATPHARKKLSTSVDIRSVSKLNPKTLANNAPQYTRPTRLEVQNGWPR